MYGSFITDFSQVEKITQVHVTVKKKIPLINNIDASADPP